MMTRMVLHNHSLSPSLPTTAQFLMATNSHHCNLIMATNIHDCNLIMATNIHDCNLIMAINNLWLIPTCTLMVTTNHNL